MRSLVRRLFEQRIRARRARARRHSALYEFAATHGFQTCPPQIEPEAADPLLEAVGAGSIQAELTFEGSWDGQSATVTSVLVQRQMPFSRDGHRQPGQTLLLVVLGAPPTNEGWSVSLTDSGVDFRSMTSDPVEAHPRVIDLIREAEQKGLLCEGDHLRRAETQLASLSRWSRSSGAPEPAARLDILSALARP